MKLLRTTALTAALMTAAVMSITSAQAQLAWWGWPGLVATGNPYATAYGYYPGYGYGYGTGFGYAANSYAPAYTGYPAYAYGYGSGYGYPPDHPVTRRHISSRPFTRRHIPLWAGGGHNQ